jgi:hypothetical protein
MYGECYHFNLSGRFLLLSEVVNSVVADLEGVGRIFISTSTWREALKLTYLPSTKPLFSLH